MFFIAISLASAGECLDVEGNPPSDVRAQGQAFARQALFDRALPCFEAAVASKPGPHDWSNLGSVRHDLASMASEMGDEEVMKTHSEASIEAFDKALALPNPPIQVYLLQAGNYARLDRVDEGTALLVELLPKVRAPQAREAILDRLGQLAELPGPQIQAEVEAYRDAFRIGSQAVGPAMKVAEGKEGEIDVEATKRGILSLERAIEHHPRAWAAWWVKGKGHEALGEEDEARAAFEAAYGINPSHADVARELILAFLRQGEVGGAKPVSTAIVKLHPEDATLLANHALVLLMSGDTKGAQAWVAKSLKVAPSDPVTLALKDEIRAVAAGEKPAPKTLP